MRQIFFSIEHTIFGRGTRFIPFFGVFYVSPLNCLYKLICCNQKIGKSEYIGRIHFFIKIALLVVQVWHTHEMKDFSLYFNHMQFIKYVHTKAQLCSFLKAHKRWHFLKMYRLHITLQLCLCVQINLYNFFSKLETFTFHFMGVPSLYDLYISF